VSVYDELGVRRVINASATLTVLGGSLMSVEVLEAMRGAAASFVDMHEYHSAAGRRLAELTRNEAAYVTAGCAAALSISALACITLGDPGSIAHMPAGDGLRTQIVMHRSQRMPYDPALRLVGAEIVEIGNILQTFEWELESAIGPKTAAVLYVAGDPYAKGALDLETVLRIAHRHDVPVVVDAAAQLPPVTNLWHFTRDLGADLALFSGGKGLHGPQASGLIVGRPDLIEACSANGAPYQRLVRAMKVGKEEIAGLVRAVEIYVAVDHAAEQERFEEICATWVTELSELPGVRAVRDWPNEAGQPTPRVLVRLAPGAAMTSQEVQRRLWDGNPRIAVAPFDAEAFHITPDTLQDGEDRTVSKRISELLSHA